MTKLGKRTVWSLGIVGALGLGGWLALQYAIARNGPAVIDTIDRVTGSGRDIQLVDKALFGDNPAQKIAVYRDRNSEGALPVLLFVHGGSWQSGDPDDYGFIARSFAPEGFVVVLAGYRMYPDSVFPGMLEDAAQATAWTKANIARHGGDPDRIILAGHSAGAYNVAMIALDPQWLGREGLAPSDVAGVIGLAGPYDFFPFDTDSTKASFGGATRPEETQPIHYARGNSPPMLLMTGARDTTVKPRNTQVLADAIRRKGGTVKMRIFPQMDHSDILLALASPWRRNRQVIDAMTAFARNPTSNSSPSVPVQGAGR